MQTSIVDDRYELLGLLGRGGMGDFYLARDERLGREVALKVLKERHAGSGEFVERFWREAKNAASLSHPNVVAVFDGGEDEDGGPYMAMEHVAGGTLADRLGREGPLEPEEAVDIALRVAAALGEANRRGGSRRDVKPHTLFLTPEGDVKVGDFGIARAAEATALTEGSLIRGTASYLSPEQAMGEPVGPASDLYSSGVVLYEMLSGRVAFDSDSPVAITIKHVTEPPPSVREANPSVPEALEAVVMRLLAKDPGERYGDAEELARELERSTDVSYRALPTKAMSGRAGKNGARRLVPRKVSRTVLSASPLCAGMLTVAALRPFGDPTSLYENVQRDLTLSPTPTTSGVSNPASEGFEAQEVVAPRIARPVSETPEWEIEGSDTDPAAGAGAPLLQGPVVSTGNGDARTRHDEAPAPVPEGVRWEQGKQPEQSPAAAQTGTVSSTAPAAVPQGPSVTPRIEATRSRAAPGRGFATRVSPAPALPEHPRTTGPQTGSVAAVEPASSAPSVGPTTPETEPGPVQPQPSQPTIPEPAGPGVSSRVVPDASGAPPEDVTVASPGVRAATSGVRLGEEVGRRPVGVQPFTDGPGAAGAPHERVAILRSPQ